MPSRPDHLLSDIRVLDFSRALAGPACTRVLAEMGADVIKVEGTPLGDRSRRGAGPVDRAAFFVQQNRGKQSLCLNLREPKALEILEGLVPQVDVVVENFRPGVIAEMGLGYERLKELREDIILCSISALGQSGPLAHKPGYDYIAQAYAGATSMIGDPSGPPSIGNIGMGDIGAGMNGALAIVSALHYRGRTGEGQHLDVSILDAYYQCHETNVHQYSQGAGKVQPTRAGRHMTHLFPTGVFRVAGDYIVIMAHAQHWPDLCRAMDRPELSQEPKFKNDRRRLECVDEIVKLIEDWLQRFPDRESAIAHLESFDVPVAPVLTVGESTTHPHLRERGTVRTIHDAVQGDFDVPGVPIKFSAFPEPLPLDAPHLGQHNCTVLGEHLGLDAEQVRQLREAGVLLEREPG
jgi:crotonobetainyl-CoA:carnitine CoA-transferase CaiB-like acyl-CoA transferase